MKHLAFAIAGLTLFAAPLSASAATVYVTPQVTAVLNQDYSPVDPALIVAPGVLAPRAEPYVLQVDVNVRTEGLGGKAVGFASTAFNLRISGAGKLYYNLDQGLDAWRPDNPKVDTNGPEIGGIENKWDINLDEFNRHDVRAVIIAGITTGFGPPEFDIRRTLTQGDGDIVGSFYLEFPGAGGSHVRADLLVPWGAATYDADGRNIIAENEAIGGSTIWFGHVPEPTTLLLSCIGVLTMPIFARRQRQSSAR